MRTVQSFTGELHRLADWLIDCWIETVAMESTGVNWIPLYEILDARGIAVIVANARDVKHVPGRKTDVNDAQWLQQLHEYGRCKASKETIPQALEQSVDRVAESGCCDCR